MIDYYANGKNIIFAKKIEIGESNVRSWLYGTLPKLDAIEKIAINCENISLKWLLTGEGTMLKTDTPDDGTKTEEETASDGVTAALERIIQRQAKEIARLEIELEKYRQDGSGQ